jgi:magnesium transporter
MPAPELLYLLHGDPAELAETLAGMRVADVAEALGDLPPGGAAKVLAALPFDLAVQVFDEPELDRRYEVVQRMDTDAAVALLEAMSADQRADVFRELGEADRERLLARLDEETQSALTLLLRYPPDTAGGIMTTEALTVPLDWSVGQTLDYITRVARSKETVYVVYVVDDDERLVGVVSLRQLMLADRNSNVRDAGDRRAPIALAPRTDREEVARVIAKYNLLAIPVVDEASHVLGIVTVDDVIDAIVHEQTEDVQKFGGMEALDAPYMEIGLGRMIRKPAPWL